MPAPVITQVPRVAVDDSVFDWELAEAQFVAADAEISIPLIFAIICLLGWLYGAKYLLIPLLKLIKVPGTSWFSDAVNFVLGAITQPITDYAKVIYAWIATGIDAMTKPIANAMESVATIIHDTIIETATTFALIATALHTLRYEIIPREINRALQPVRNTVKTILADIGAWNAVAKAAGFLNLRTMLKIWAPAIAALRIAEKYVLTQGHTSLAGALSYFQTYANMVKAMVSTVVGMGYTTIPAWIRHIETEIVHTIPKAFKALTLRVGKIENLLKLNGAGIPVLLALMAPAAIARFFRPAIPAVCTEVGDCAANNLLGKSNWQWLKDFLALALLPTIDALALADLCAIANLAQDTARAFEPELRTLAVVAGGLSSIGCASPGISMGEPLY